MSATAVFDDNRFSGELAKIGKRLDDGFAFVVDEHDSES